MSTLLPAVLLTCLVACSGSRSTSVDGGGGEGDASDTRDGHVGDFDGHVDDHDGGSSESDPCRSDEDCDSPGFLTCLPPGGFHGCGICQMPSLECETDEECTESMGAPAVCLRFVAACSFPFSCGAGEDPSSTLCQPACTADSCASGERCEADGRCVAISCDDGFSCAPGTECHPAPGTHGCQRVTCAVDTDCAEGLHCVDGGCYESLGSCVAPVA